MSNENVAGRLSGPFGSPQIDVKEQIRIRQGEIPESARKTFERSVLGEGSPRQAIKAHCQTCMGYDDMVAGIRDCAARLCPLWAYRPYQEKSN